MLVLRLMVAVNGRSSSVHGSTVLRDAAMNPVITHHQHHMGAAQQLWCLGEQFAVTPTASLISRDAATVTFVQHLYSYRPC